MSNKPTHTAYVVSDEKFTDKNGKERSRWSEIGVAFQHKDGKGFDITLDALPTKGRIVLRLNTEKPAAQ